MRSRLLHGFLLRNALIEPLKTQISFGDARQNVSADSMEVLLHLVNHSNRFVPSAELIDAIWEGVEDSQKLLAQSVDELRRALRDDQPQPAFIESHASNGYRLLVDPYTRDNERIPREDRRADEQTQFFGELLHRGVVQTGLTYLVVGWLLIQISDVMFDKLPLPGWSAAFVTWLVIGGFPIALALSWFLDFASGRWRWQSSTQPTARKKFLSRTHLSVLVALFVAGAAVTIYQATIGFPEPTSVEIEEDVIIEPNTIAVLPFRTLGDQRDERARVFATGLAEDVGNRLTRIPGMLASSSRDARSLLPGATTGEIRRRLRVAYYVQGTVRLDKDNLRVAIQLIDTDGGFEVASRVFDRKLSEFFGLQDEITGLTVASLRPALPDAMDVIPQQAAEGIDIDAYYHYRKGAEIMFDPVTTESLELALDSFDASLAIDAEYAAAYAGKCQAFLWGFRLRNDSDFVHRAEQACALALSLSPNLDVVYDALGRLYFSTGREVEAEAAYEKSLEIFENGVDARIGLARIYARRQEFGLAEEMLRDAIALQPGNWRAFNGLGLYHFRRGQYQQAAEAYSQVTAIDRDNMTGFGNLGASLMMSGDFSRAITAFERSIELEPQDTAYSNLGMLHYYSGDFEKAIDAFRESISLAPDDYLAWSNLGDALHFVGDHDDSRAAFERAARLAEAHLDVNPQDAEVIDSLSWIKTMLGQYDEAKVLTARSLELSPTDPYTHFSHALVLVRAAEGSDDIATYTTLVDQALEALAKAKRLGYPIKLLGAEPHLDSIKADPRFQRLLGGS